MAVGNDLNSVEPEVNRRGGIELNRQARGNRPAECWSKERERIRWCGERNGAGGPGHIVGNELEYRSAGLDLNYRGSGWDGNRVQVGAETLQGQTLLVRDSRYQAGRWLWAILAGTSALHPGSSLGNEPLQRAVCVRSSQASRSGKGVAGPGATGE
jgi:hypothetical protein